MKSISATQNKLSSAKTDTGSIAQQDKRAPYKYEMCAMELLERGSEGLWALDALRAFGTTCLNSDISDLFNNRGVKFRREPYRHTTRYETTVIFTQYSPQTKEDVLALVIIVNDARSKRGVAPLAKGRVAMYLALIK
ncbi:hypothetical protein AB4510_19945 [Vibrio sp. 10N.222.54.B12]|uniref:hypothetical protein n=1 Tax=unclassified Vibrio TaxID=2614977 RepID=UPI00354AD8F3